MNQLTNLFLTLGLLLVVTTTSRAALVDNLTLGNAKALALGNAVTADPPGIDAIHFNPAGLANLKGRQNEYKFLAGTFNMRVDFGEHDEDMQRALATWSDETAGFNIPEEYLVDPVVNTTSETAGAMLMLPGAGMQKLPFIAAPLGGFSFNPPGSPFTFANNVYAPTAAGYYRDEDDPGRFFGEEISLARITYFAPSVAYEVNDQLKIGGSVGFSYQGVGVGLSLRVPNIGLVAAVNIGEAICGEDGEGVIDICQGVVGPFTEVSTLYVEADNPLSVTYNLGFLWEPTHWLTLGMVYQSGDEMVIEGDYEINYHPEWSSLFTALNQDPNGQALIAASELAGYELPKGASEELGKIRIELTQPQHVAIGTSIQVTPKLKFNMDAKWTEWSTWEELTLQFDETLDFLRLARIVQPSAADYKILTFPMGFRDIWNFSFGMEYQYSANLALRLGYEPRPSSIPDDKQSVLLPVGNGDLYGTGLSWKLSSGAIFEAALGYMKTETHLDPGESSNSNSLDQSQFIYNPYAGLEIDTEVTAYLVEFSYRKTLD